MFKVIYCATAEDARKWARTLMRQGYKFGGSATKRGIHRTTVCKGLADRIVLQAPNR